MMGDYLRNRQTQGAVEQLSATWAGDSSATLTPGYNFELLNITVHFDAAISNNCTVTLDSGVGANYDTLLATAQNAGGQTSNFFTFGTVFAAADQIVVACNVGANNAYLTATLVRR